MHGADIDLGWEKGELFTLVRVKKDEMDGLCR